MILLKTLRAIYLKKKKKKYRIGKKTVNKIKQKIKILKNYKLPIVFSFIAKFALKMVGAVL